ncbi:MAG: alanine--tRNA ligase [Candidatus Omnitrophica bacterium]|nr:alanine--tRNA ligase [Candidatus Omnitrophota bacterium]
MLTNELRKKYLEFFRKKNHKIFPSDSLIPDDPSVLFTSAGMNQFKAYFLGEKKDVKRATSAQKCLRTGDIEEVGRTAYHHTFFEMLGNFSFGDYFKKEAIEFAWEFITKELNLKKEILWVSVYNDDEEAYGIWKNQIQIDEKKIVRLGEDKNFWPASAPSKGPDGPCGPCSEIFFDNGKHVGCQKPNCSPACDCGRFVEFWNLVFTQFNRAGENKLEPLPQKNIDTGMGLERMASILQGKSSNFEIDILQPAVNSVVERLKVDLNPKTKSLINAIVDHSRAATFSIADGVYPSNEDRGYVVRKIIRKALYHAHTLGYKEIFLYTIVDLYAELMQEPYPEVTAKKDVISKVIRAEEEKFISTLNDAKTQFFSISENLKKQKKDTIPAADLFRLYDTYGLPLELSRDMAKEISLKVDENGFGKFMLEQRERSRKQSMFDENIFKTEAVRFEEKSEFLGYSVNALDADILQLVRVKENSGYELGSEKLEAGEEGVIVLNKTCFYAESGGQLTDKGLIATKSGEFLVEKVFKVQDAILHKGKVIKGVILKGKAHLVIDEKRRQSLKRAHTATHLLQAALRGILGAHVAQQGSLVDEDRFRFDFTHFKALSGEEIERLEDCVNEYILNADKVIKEELSYDEAKATGALAFFKDKYKDKVRVVSIGDYSKEFCGGTHLDVTSEIGVFFIVSESSISSGIRRIEAVVGEKAYTRIKSTQKALIEAAAMLKCQTQEVPAAIKQLQDEVRALNEEVKQSNKEKISSKIDDIVKAKKEISGFVFLTHSFKNIEPSDLVFISDGIKKRLGSVFVFLVSESSGKNIFICSTTDDYAKKKAEANKFVSFFKEELSLKGGGKPTLVQGVVAGFSEDLLLKVENCFVKFLQK